MSELGIVTSLAAWAEPWRHAVSHSPVLSTGVLFAHLSALVCAGGLSLSADIATMRADVGLAVASNRRLALRALVVLLLTGVALFFSDVAAFAYSATFWVKMGLVAMLATNACGARAAGPARQRLHAMASLGLWFVTLAAGTALMNG
jgi:hypothetical protein